MERREITVCKGCGYISGWGDKDHCDSDEWEDVEVVSAVSFDRLREHLQLDKRAIDMGLGAAKDAGDQDRIDEMVKHRERIRGLLAALSGGENEDG